MLELTFHDSAAGALELVRQSGVGLGAVLPFTSAFDVGALCGDDLGRRDALTRLFGFFPDGEAVVSELLFGNAATAARLLRADAEGEPVRLWAQANVPAELCGVHYVCSLLEDGGAPLSIVWVPEETEDAGAPVRYRGTGDVPPERLAALAETAVPVDQDRRRAYAGAWRALAEENAPLRAVVNGRLMSVPETFYDFALRAHIPAGKFRAALPIGRTLAETPGVSDGWLYLRLRAFVRAGELAEIAPPEADHPYSGVLQRRERP